VKLIPLARELNAPTLNAHARPAGPGRIRLEFEWDPEWRRAGLERSGSKPGHRLHELWKTTCFEAFLNFEGEAYFEINLAPDGSWNAYRFDRYRLPQPPQEAQGWSLLEFACRPGLCNALIQGSFGDALPKRVGLTAVLEIRDEILDPALRLPGRIEYRALRHAGTQPDFHDPAGWLPAVDIFQNWPRPL